MKELWANILAIASALVLLSKAAEKIAEALRAVRAPNRELDKRMKELEQWRESVDCKLDRDNDRLASIEKGTKVSQRALLALLDHGIDGNNIKQMEDAKNGLMNSLIDRQGGVG